MLIACRNGMAVKFPVTAKNYVQDGLVAMWDGIENAGWKKHDSSATTWKDLVGNRDLTCTNVTWTDTMAVFSGNGHAHRDEIDSTAMGAESRTMEVCFQSSSNINSMGIVNINNSDGPGTYYRWRLACGGYSGRIIVANGRYITNPYMIVRDNQQIANGVTFAVTAYQSSIQSAYWNGILASTNGTEYWIRGGYGETIGSNNGSAYYTGNVACVRCYSKILTTDELLANYAVDKIRFNLP